jgi:hypothetical protein
MTNEHTEPIDSNSLRIRLDGKHEYRKDIINRSRRRWQTSNKSKAVMRSADAFADVVETLEQLLSDDQVSDDLKRELVEQLDSRHFELWYDVDVGISVASK